MNFTKATIMELPDGSHVDIEEAKGGYVDGKASWKELSLSVVEPDGFKRTFVGIDFDGETGALEIKLFGNEVNDPVTERLIRHIDTIDKEGKT